MRSRLLCLACIASAKQPIEAELSAESRSAILAMTGLYTDARAAGNGANATVLLTSANWGYRGLLFSWMCRAAELGLKYAVHAHDERLHAYLRERAHPRSPSTTFSVFREASLAGAESERFEELGGAGFARATCAKAALLRAVMEQLRVDVWFSDADVAFVRDPWPSFARAACDVQYATFTPHARRPPSAAELFDVARGPGGGAKLDKLARHPVNTGFVLWRASDAAVALARAIDGECSAQLRSVANASDQSATNVGVLWQYLAKKNRTRHARIALPRVQLELLGTTFDWRSGLAGGVYAPRPFTRGDDARFYMCPLPMLVATLGFYFFDRRPWEEAEAKVGHQMLASVHAAQAGPLHGKDAKLAALKGLASWALKPGVDTRGEQGGLAFPGSCRGLPYSRMI